MAGKTRGARRRAADALARAHAAGQTSGLAPFLASDKLHIGCGNVRLAGFVNADISKTAATDIVMDCSDLSSLPASRFACIYANAFFEHLYIGDRLRCLRSARHTLKDDGVVIFTGLPDFETVSRAYLAHRGLLPGPQASEGLASEAVQNYLYGAPVEPEHRAEGLHKGLFDAPTLERLLREAGFEHYCVFRYCWGSERLPVNLGFAAFKARPVQPLSASFIASLLSQLPANANPDTIELLATSSRQRAEDRKATFAAVYCVYDDSTWLDTSLESVYDACDAIYLLVSDRPWNGEPGDNSATIACIEAYPDPAGKLRLVQGSWSSEAEQRNAGLDMLRAAGYDYCFVVDADEVYDTAALKAMMDVAASEPEVPCWHMRMDTYWKEELYRIEPREPLMPVVFVKVGAARFSMNRNAEGAQHKLISPAVGFCHHLSYARSDEQVRRKISTFSHANEIVSGWYENVWRKWDSDRGMTNLHPTHPAAYQRAIPQPYVAMPPALRKRFLARSARVPGRVPGLASVIILTRNALQDTRACLDSIERHTAVPYELVLVDNASTDGSAEYLSGYASERDNVSLVLNATNRGFAGGNNQGLALARGEYVLLLNNDTIVTEGWLEHMLAALREDLDLGMVGPVSNNISGAQRVPAQYHDLTSLEHFAAEWTAANAGKRVPTARLVGFCLLMRRAVIDRIGGLDERFFPGNFEDDDLCLRAQAAGFKLAIAADAFVHHAGGRSFAANGLDFDRAMKENWERFVHKWGIQPDAQLGKPYSVNVSVEMVPRFYIPLKREILFAGFAVTREGRLLVEEGAQATGNAAARDEAARLNETGVRFFSQGRLAAAVQALEQACALDPANVAVLGNLAQAYMAQQDYAKASECYRKAIAIDADDADVLLGFAGLCRAMGDTEGALIALERVKVLAPSMDGLDEALVELRAQQAALEGAR